MSRDAVREAKGLLALASWGEPGLFQRAAVLLTREALETSMKGFWARHSPDLQRASTRAQLDGLAVFLEDDILTAGDTAHLWNTLSRACHYDDGYLSPGATEVADWLARAERLCSAIDRHAASS